MGRIYVIGIGPGDISSMTKRALQAIEECDVIVGYRVYTDLVKEICTGKQVIESGMRQETERCRTCIDLAKEGRTVGLVCSGDAGVYGMASPMLEIAEEEGFSDVVIIPGVTSALSSAALLGAPIGHDFCVISLSDLLTPWDVIEKRLNAAAMADFCIVIYNPASNKRPDYLKRACQVMSTTIPPERPCGYVRNAGRDGENVTVCTFEELDNAAADMYTTVFIGNSATKVINGKLITPRGYTID